jgi:hypothetical protein
VLADGLLKQVQARLHFMHQSIQDYFTACHFRAVDPLALADFTPKHTAAPVWGWLSCRRSASCRPC